MNCKIKKINPTKTTIQIGLETHSRMNNLKLHKNMLCSFFAIGTCLYYKKTLNKH